MLRQVYELLLHIDLKIFLQKSILNGQKMRGHSK